MIEFIKTLFVVNEKPIASIQTIGSLSSDVVHGWFWQILFGLDIRNISRHLSICVPKSTACCICHLLPLLCWFWLLFWHVGCCIVTSMAEREWIDWYTL